MGKGDSIKLEDLVTIQPGYQHRGQMTNDAGGNLAVIQVLNLNHDLRVVNQDELWKMSTDKDFTTYQVTDSDLLYLSRGSRFGAYMIPRLNEPTIPLSHFFILRPKKDAVVGTSYLWWILNERRMAKQVQSQMRGSVMPFIGRHDLGQLTIPIPPKATQELLVEFTKLRNKERQLLMQLEATKEKLYQAGFENKIYGEEPFDFAKELRKL
jgi:restriction endonuclease S subunit